MLVRPSAHFLRGALLVVAVALLPSLRALPNGFVLDDQGQILLNRYVRSANIRALLTSDYWAGFGGRVSGLYRPLTSLSFALEFRLWGEWPAPYRLANILVHVGCSLTLFSLIGALTGLAPPVDMVTSRSSLRTTAGRVKVHRSGWSTTFTGMPAADAWAATRTLTSRISVALITRQALRRSDLR